MKVLVTGHHGYIGSVMTGVLSQAGHDVTGLDTYLYEGCDFGDEAPAGAVDSQGYSRRRRRRPSRVRRRHPSRRACRTTRSGCLDESCTYDINHLGSVILARAAKAAGVPRFLFASSCSLYGAAGDTMLDETRRLQPDHRVRHVEGAGRSGRRRSWPTTPSVPRFCATRPPTASPRGCAPTSSSTTWWASPTPPAKC